MKVYIAIGTYDYEGGAVLGVFSNREAAERVLAVAEWHFDGRGVREVEVDDTVEIWL